MSDGVLKPMFPKLQLKLPERNLRRLKRLSVPHWVRVLEKSLRPKSSVKLWKLQMPLGPPPIFLSVFLYIQDHAFPSEYLHVKFYLGKKTCLVKGKETNLKNNYLNYLFSHYLASNINKLLEIVRSQRPMLLLIMTLYSVIKIQRKCIYFVISI